MTKKIDTVIEAKIRYRIIDSTKHYKSTKRNAEITLEQAGKAIECLSGVLMVTYPTFEIVSESKIVETRK